MEWEKNANSSVLKDPIEIAFRKIYVKINCLLKPNVSQM